MIEKGVEIAPADGKLGILLVGLGAVSTTLVAGVEAIRRGLAQPVGSLTRDVVPACRYGAPRICFQKSSAAGIELDFGNQKSQIDLELFLVSVFDHLARVLVGSVQVFNLALHLPARHRQCAETQPNEILEL